MHIGIEGTRPERLDERVGAKLEALRARLTETVAELVKIPSENTPPAGAELACQRYLRDRLAALGLDAELYDPGLVQGMAEHAGYRRGHDYADRPNLSAVWRGSGGGKSLLLSGHADTVPRGSEPWHHDPFAATVEGNRLYGLGANDMKGGIGAMIVAVEALRQAGVRLRGDLFVETIVDEEFGGVNGTLAGRVRGPNPDAAIICEPSHNVICPAQMGGRTAHITLRSGSAGILSGGAPETRVVDQLEYLLGRIREFASQRRHDAPAHALYPSSRDPVPVWVTKVSAGGWGPGEPITIPGCCRIELYWQTMPGEEQPQIERAFFSWLDAATSARPDLFPAPPEVRFPIEWLPGSALDPQHELVTRLATTFQDAAGVPAQVRGIEGPCDMFVFHQMFGVPAVLFGPKGGNTHAPDEWVDLDSVFLTAQVLTRFVCSWCEVE